MVATQQQQKIQVSISRHVPLSINYSLTTTSHAVHTHQSTYLLTVVNNVQLLLEKSIFGNWLTELRFSIFSYTKKCIF